MMYGAAQDLQRCMAHLMEFKEEDVLEIPTLDSLDNVPIVYPAPLKEVTLLKEPQVAQATPACPLRCRKQAPELEVYN